MIEFFNTAIEDVDLYAHDQHTCYNEGANGNRTHDMPKHKTFPSTAMSRTAGARLKFNEGVGVAKELIHKNLGLAPNRLQAAEWKRLDGQRASTKKRRATEAFRHIANYKRKAKRRKHELAVSKKRGDEYRAADKKAKTTMTDTAKTTTTNTAKRPLPKVHPRSNQLNG